MILDYNNQFYAASGSRVKTAVNADFALVGSQLISTNVLDLGGPGSIYTGTWFMYVRLQVGSGGAAVLTTPTKVYFDLYTDYKSDMSGAKAIVGSSGGVLASAIVGVAANAGKILAIVPINVMLFKQYLAVYTYADAAATVTTNITYEVGLVDDVRLNSYLVSAATSLQFAGQ